MLIMLVATKCTKKHDKVRIKRIVLDLHYTVPPENIYPFTEVLPRPIRRLTPRSCLGKDAACQNFTEVLPRFAAAYNIAVNGKTR